MFFHISRRSASSANQRQALQTLTLPSLDECKLGRNNLKTRTASPSFTRKATDWCKSTFKNAINHTPQHTSNSTTTLLPTCPRHPAALWDGITYAYANADEAFAAEEARRKIIYDAPCQCSIGASVALKTPLSEEVEPQTHRSTDLPLIRTQKNIIRSTVPRTEESNEILITLVVAPIASNAPLRITFPVIARITYTAPLLITFPHTASNLASLLAFTSAKPMGFTQLPQVRLGPLDAVRSTITSSVVDLRVAPLIFGGGPWAPVTSASARVVAMEAAPVGLATSSTPIPEWFIEMTRSCAPTSSDAWRQRDILPPTRPQLFIELPQTLWSSTALSRPPSPSLSSVTISPTSTSNVSRLSNDDLLANAVLSSPATTTLDDEELHEKNCALDLDDFAHSSPWKITKRTPGTVASVGGWALNPCPLAVPGALLIALFPEDYVGTAFKDTSLVECQVDEESASDLDGWSDIGSIPDEVDQHEAIALFPADSDDTHFQTSLVGCYLDEEPEEDFESWSEMGSIPDELDVYEVSAASSPIHHSKSTPISLDSSLHSTPSDTSFQCEDWPNLPFITLSPATSLDDEPKEDGWPFELEIFDDGLSPELVEGMQSVTDFILAGLVEDEGDIFDESGASLVEPEVIEDTDTDTDTGGLPDMGSSLDTTETACSTGWPKHVLEDLEIITRFVLAGLKPGESLDFDVSDILPELKHTIASPTDGDAQHAGPILVNTKVEPVTTRAPPSPQSTKVFAGNPSLSPPTRPYADMNHGHSKPKKTDRHTKRSSFLSSKLALLADMENQLIEKGLGIYI
ncbi:hypothetical protein FRB96_006961 [Tulasnella sp. 330]|nr:hypothetical protein FRB96_006961 [Tulasnella sp. 330]KAG8883831.1 hypothetical protein FRB97_005835 [Tulasnella sp. 331]